MLSPIALRRRATLTLALTSFLGLASSTLAAPPDPGEPRIAEVRVGFGGRYKVGQWTPVTVTIQGGSQSHTGHVQLIVADGDDVPSRITSSKPYLVGPGQTVTAHLHAKFGRIESRMRVVFLDLGEGDIYASRTLEDLEDGDATHLPWAMFSSQELVVGLGGQAGVDEALKLHQMEKQFEPRFGRIETVDQMPTRWFGYEGVDSLVVCTSQPEMYRSLADNSDQVAALDQWVRMGGRLVLCVGENAQEILDPGHPFARFSPGKFEKMTALPDTKDLEAYSESQEPLRAAKGSDLRLPVPQMTGVRGRVEVPDVPGSDLPLVIRTPYGFGEVVFVALDLDRKPFVDWKARGPFVSKLLGKPAVATEAPSQSNTEQLTNLGLTDLTGQLRGALDQFEGVKLVPFWIVAGSVFLYILLIGPGDYFLVRNWLKRMELTWITFPSIVLAVSLGAYFLAVWAKGSELRLNQVDLVDVLIEPDQPYGLARGTTWLNIFTPRTEVYRLAFQPRLPDGRKPEEAETSVVMSWLGLPGSGFGGSDQKRSNQPLFNRPYDYLKEASELDRLPIHVWSTKSLTARWQGQDDGSLEVKPPATDEQAKGLTASDDKQLQGELISSLKVPLDDCWLAYDRWLYQLGRLEPGQAIDLKSRWKDREVLANALTGNRLDYDSTKKQNLLVSTAYDPSSFDARRILRQMMFFKASGGEPYARLVNRYQAFVDMSDHLMLGRAILVGFTDKPGADLHRSFDGGQTWGEPVKGPQDKRTTCYRFVIPVEAEQERDARKKRETASDADAGMND